MEMRHDEVGVVHLRVEGHGRDHDARQPAEDEGDDEGEHEEHRNFRIGLPLQSVASQQKICRPAGTAIVMLEAVKKLSPSFGRR